jgi:nucleoside-diphosphate-sugar epimerase
MATYLVTGGAGFIGSALVRELLDRGERVRVLDNLSTGKLENLAPVRDHIELIQGDVTDESTVRRAVEGVDYVLHQAAIPSVPRSIVDPLGTHRSNVDGTLQVLVAASQAGVKRVVYAASSSAYGDTPTLPKHESMPPNPLSPYAVAKLVGEYYASVFTSVYGLETVSLRYFNIFGPRQDPTSPYSGVLSRFITALLRDEQPVVFGDGEQSRDFTFVANAVQANLLACTAEGAPGRVFNLGVGERYTLNRTLEVLGRIFEKDARPAYREPRAGDVRHSQADISAAREVLGYNPTVGFEEGLRRTVEWYKENLAALFSPVA